VAEKNIFNQETRNFPIDFGAPVEEKLMLEIEIPDGYSVVEKPSDVTYDLGKSDGRYKFTCTNNGNKIMINSLLQIDRTSFPAAEYKLIQDFYSKILEKQAELIVIKKNS
jgi:hypothetical protein